jgi:phosphate transport system substrate-binding protein
MIKKILVLLIIALFAFTACKGGSSSDKIQIAGSTTIEGMVVEMAKAFKKEAGIDVIVRGGGSGRGVDGVLRNTIDIGNASRDIKSKEIKKLQEKGVKVKRIKVGIDGICVIVNKAITGIETMDIETLTKIFTGKVKNWKELGGPDKEIVVYTRDKKSGTGEFFNHVVLGKKHKLLQNRRETTGNADLASKVAADAQGIGYVGFAFAEQVAGQTTIMKLSHKAKGVNDTIEPTAETISNMSYPISRYVYQFVREDKFNGKIKQFIDFILKRTDIVKKTGFLPVNADAAVDSVW